jgi:hypothetical protein
LEVDGVVLEADGVVLQADDVVMHKSARYCLVAIAAFRAAKYTN